MTGSNIVIPEDWRMPPYRLAGALFRKLGMPWQDITEYPLLDDGEDIFHIMAGYENAEIVSAFDPDKVRPADAHRQSPLFAGYLACMLTYGRLSKSEGPKRRMKMVLADAPMAYYLFRVCRDPDGAYQLSVFLLCEYSELFPIREPVKDIVAASVVKGV